MQNGEFIKDRWIVGMVQEVCTEIEASVRSFSGDWVLELKKDEMTRYVFGYKFGLNDAVSASIAQDKVAAYQVMSAHGVDAVEHYLIRPSDGSSWERLPLGGDMIIKPLTGTGGRGVERCRNVAIARQKVEESKQDAWAVSPFYDIEREVRFIILDEDVLLMYEKQPVIEAGLKFFNLGKGAVPMPVIPSLPMRKLAVDAVRAIGLLLGVVDIVIYGDGKMKVLEVNDGVMMENFARHSEANKIQALGVYRTIVKKIFS